MLENIDSEPDTVVVLSDCEPTQAEQQKKAVNEQCTGTQDTDVVVPLQRSARESQAPCRLIEELQEPLYIF